MKFGRIVHTVNTHEKRIDRRSQIFDLTS